jgi:hypothetical protein
MCSKKQHEVEVLPIPASIRRSAGARFSPITGETPGFRGLARFLLITKPTGMPD